MNDLSNNEVSTKPNKLIILSVLAIFLSIFSIVFSYTIGKTSLSSQNSLNWNVVQTQGGEVDVYLSGPTAAKVVGADLSVFFDSGHIKVSSVEAGGFFGDPIVVKLDNENLSYSLILNPENKISNDPSKPMFRFHLASTKLTGNKFYILPGSQVYLHDIGGTFPKTSQIILK